VFIRYVDTGGRSKIKGNIEETKGEEIGIGGKDSISLGAAEALRL
jgi:hypothetical protein